MVQLIAFIIFLVSLSGIAFIVGKKLPALAKLPQNGNYGFFKKNEFIVGLTKKIKDTHFHFFEKQMLLHKFLSWIRIFALKLEARVDKLLHGIRKKAQELDKETKRKR